MDRELEAKKGISTAGRWECENRRESLFFFCPVLTVGKVLGLVLKYSLKPGFVTWKWNFLPC